MPDMESLLIIFSPLTSIDLTPCKQLTTLYIRKRLTDQGIPAEDSDIVNDDADVCQCIFVQCILEQTDRLSTPEAL